MRWENLDRETFVIKGVLKKLVVVLSLTGFALTGCESYQTRTFENCVPEMTFSSTAAHEFAIIKPSTAQGKANLKKWSALPVRKGEYHFYISSPYIVGVERKVEDLGLEFVKLPEGTELKLEGTVKRHVPLGLQRTFSPSIVYLKGKVGSDTVWVVSSDLTALADGKAPTDANQQLVALGLVNSDNYLYVGDEKWRCPK